MKRVLILGAAGRDFHDFNCLFRNNRDYQVVAFTATQIPEIAGRRYPPALAGALYPDGIPIIDEKEIELLIRSHQVDIVVFSYSDISHANLMHLASRVLACGADFWLPGARHTMVESRVPVISICAVRTGCGKSPVSRHVLVELKRMGWHPVVVRHPMPYGNLADQAVQRFATLSDLEKHQCTIEECEEYEPHIMNGTVVYAGVDYEAILRRAEQEADLVLWDGGNNDTPFFKSDLEIVVTDPHRAGHEMSYFPGEVNLRRGQVIVINKVNTAPAEGLETVRNNIRRNNPAATMVEMACRVTADDEAAINGKHVLVVEDGPTLTHGEMSYGAGVVAARQFHAASLVDPRPHAVGSIRRTFEKYTHLHDLLPAMGYHETQRRELEETINRTPCDLVVIATPVDLRRIVSVNKPCVRIGYEVESLTQPSLREVLAQFSEMKQPRRAPEVALAH